LYFFSIGNTKRVPVIDLYSHNLVAVSVHHTQRTQYFADVRVVHVWAGLEDLPALLPSPHHEGVHRALDVGPVGLGLVLLGTDDLRTKHLTCNQVMGK